MTLSSCAGAELASGLKVGSGGSFKQEIVCLEAGLGGLQVDVGGGGDRREISWIISFPDGDVQSGGAGYFQLCSVTCVDGTEKYTAALSDSASDGSVSEVHPRTSLGLFFLSFVN